MTPPTEPPKLPDVFEKLRESAAKIAHQIAARQNQYTETELAGIVLNLIASGDIIMYTDGASRMGLVHRPGENARLQVEVDRLRTLAVRLAKGLGLMGEYLGKISVTGEAGKIHREIIENIDRLVAEAKGGLS
jgi:hypothetical protein